MADQTGTTQLVVIGASAGGIDALSTVVANLPVEFLAPIVVAQHLDPARPSHLAGILARRSTLPIKTVTDRMPLENGVIYVVPANRHVEITDHEVSVAMHDGRLMPSVDLLLSTAASVFGEGLIAVILTGTGSDGAVGARAVKEAGGTVVIQNPQTAQFSGMPAAIAPPLVDVIVEIESIGQLLSDLLTGAYLPTRPGENRSLRTLLQQIHDTSGIDFNQYKMPTIQRRLQRRMVATGVQRLSDYMSYLDSHPEEYERLVGSFLIKVTEFFRDPELFDYLRVHILPDLITTARSNDNELRLWSARCATGEEAYSLAIMVAEILGDELERFTVRIFATDLDTAAVNYARRGIYPTTALIGVAPEWIERYFLRHDGSYEVTKRIRGLVVFGEHDLGRRAPFPRIDLCMCRNVLIYFTAELQRRALQLFAFSLRNGGYLVLGNAETPSVTADLFVAMHPKLRLYKRQGSRMLIPPIQLRETSTLRHAPPEIPSGRMRQRKPTPFTRQGLRPQNTAEIEASHLLRTLPIGVLVINQRYDIQSINHAARGLLEIHSPAIGEDLVHLLDHLSIPGLRSAIDAVLTQGRDQILRVQMDVVSGEQRILQLTCRPLMADETGEPKEPTERLVLIQVMDMTAIEQERLTQLASHEATLRALRDTHAQEVQNLRESEQQLRVDLQSLEARMERVVKINAELERANERLSVLNAELHSSNEEFLVGNEESQAAMEEVETLNEEMQATNEELETLNEELQATVEELNTTNDDLEARNYEMYMLAEERERQRQQSDAERARLAAVLSSMEDAVLVVDAHQQVVLANGAVERLFGAVGAGFVPEDEQGHPLPAEDSPLARAARGETFNMTFTVLDSNGRRRWFEATGSPTKRDDASQNSVVVIRDVTDHSLRRLQEEFLVLASHELRTPLTPLSGYLQMLRRLLSKSTGTTQANAQHYLDLMQENLRSLQRLINDLLDIGRLQEGKLSLVRNIVDLVPLTQNLVEAMQLADMTPPLHLEVTAQTLPVHGDATRLTQIIHNLVANALQHASNSPHIDIRLSQDDTTAVLDIQDYGKGIPEESRAHLFERFYQGNSPSAHKGLGLGLYITRELVQAHNGQITVQSEEGTGSTFTVRLPLLEQTGSPPAATSQDHDT